MDSYKLSIRAKQPGHDITFRKSETSFATALKLILDPDVYEVKAQPQDLRYIFGRPYGIKPEAVIRNRQTSRVMYFEVKKQGPEGNADERACRHHTVQFYKTLSSFTKLDYHAYCTIFCESLATLPVYTSKVPYVIEPGHYFLWKDYDIDLLREFIVHEICGRFLDAETQSER
jgi:hypothetical protein